MIVTVPVNVLFGAEVGVPDGPAVGIAEASEVGVAVGVAVGVGLVQPSTKALTPISAIISSNVTNIFLPIICLFTLRNQYGYAVLNITYVCPIAIYRIYRKLRSKT